MKEWIKPALVIMLIVAIGAVVINDVGAVIFQALRAEDMAQKIDAEAIRVYQQTGNEDASYVAAKDAALPYQAEVYGYQYKDGKITVWIRLRPHRTIVLERFLRWAQPRYPQLHATLVKLTDVTSQYTDPVK